VLTGLRAVRCGAGPAVAIPKVLEQVGLTKDDIDVFELNEAFASQAAYCIKALGLNPDRVNPLGGAWPCVHRQRWWGWLTGTDRRVWEQAPSRWATRSGARVRARLPPSCPSSSAGRASTAASRCALVRALDAINAQVARRTLTPCVCVGGVCRHGHGCRRRGGARVILVQAVCVSQGGLGNGALFFVLCDYTRADPYSFQSQRERERAVHVAQHVPCPSPHVHARVSDAVTARRHGHAGRPTAPQKNRKVNNVTSRTVHLTKECTRN
jgi:hypothetical protein